MNDEDMSHLASPATFIGADAQLAADISTQLEAVERRLYEVTAQTRKLPDTTSQHLLAAGGKRARPNLLLLTARLGEADREEIIDAAVAVELIHLASLYHDDVMDDAPVRRGAPAAHEVWGNSVAILTGDLLFSKASGVTAKLGPEAVTVQAETFERLVLGQLNEFAGPPEDADAIDHYIQVLADKTGSLIATSAQFGVMFSLADQALAEPVRVFGERVGIAFQLADDIIDLTAASSVSGKTPGTDLREGVPTLPVLYVRAAAADGDKAAAEVVDLLDADLTSDEALESARAALAAHPVTVRARDEATRWAEDAKAALAPVPEGLVKESLYAFADSVVSRTA
ncbi:polyprenyl synthetase family protein [Brevibacterium sp. RIT 803]|uniref:polyprenyl synthetase family protein n=1 Tax=Brevibacterium sp. RIT 803 TaxID=2810210 RepID=UPI00207A30AC|nr:polyprenyl synthetase family protein [Brevibacterium sp. RIT 803]